MFVLPERTQCREIASQLLFYFVWNFITVSYIMLLGIAMKEHDEYIILFYVNYFLINELQILFPLTCFTD